MFAMNNNISFSFGLFSIILVACVVTGTGVVKDCFSTTIDDYIGHQQTTENGTPCIRWDSPSDKNTYTNDDFRDATVSDAANFCRKVGKDNLWCWTSNNGHSGTCGIKKCVNDFVEKCGNLKIKQPALLGRNVTFTFTPDSYDSNAILEWQRAAEGNPWYTRPLTYKFTQYNKNGTYFMVLTDSLAADSSTTNDEVNYRIHYYNESIRCRMETGKLELDDNPNKPCGFVYLRNERVLEGNKIFLEYYPSKNVAENPGKFMPVWVRSDNGYKPYTKFGGDIYKKDKKGNGIYVRTIPMADISMNGFYGVDCGNNDLTNTVQVVVLVPPSAPTFIGLEDIDKCKKCIVGSDKENIEVFCKTSGGTSPVNVTMTVGDESFTADSVNNISVYRTHIKLADSHHKATITCSVMNDALTLPLLTTAQVYVIKSPASVELSAPSEITEGDPVSITCLVSDSRPSPAVYLNISGIEVSSSDVYTSTASIFKPTTMVYGNNITLTMFKREWNGVNIFCCRHNKWYSTPRKCSEAKQVNFLFPPSDIKLEIKYDSVDPLRMYAACTLNNSNPACRANFRAASEVIGLERNSSNTNLPRGAWETKYVVRLNVSKEDDGKDVTCAAECADFQDLELRDTKTIKVPYRPVIKFNISGPMLSITKGEKAHIKCIAESYPASNISWIEKTDKKDKVKKQCDNEQECVLDVHADAISELYFVCAIRYLQFQDDKTLIVNIHEPYSVINMILIAGICSALLVIVVIVVLIIRDKRNNDQAKHDTVLERNRIPLRENEYIETRNDVADADDQLEVTYSQPIKKQKVAAVCDDTYAEVDKTRNKEQPATCSAESQRTEDGQLMYVDLEFNADRKMPKEVVVKRRDSPTEYVGIDFAKTAAYVAEENETTEMDSIYVNQ